MQRALDINRSRFADWYQAVVRDADERERANLAQREPERLQAMRQAWLNWAQTVPPIPEDAAVSVGYSSADMPQR